MKYDLHVHTNHSDGIFLPQKVVDLAVEANLNGIAITDHDTVSAIGPAIDYSKKYKGFKIIPGIEFGALYNDEEVHILGYFIDYKDPDIIEITNTLRESRLVRGQKMVEKLVDMGLNITLDEVKQISGNEYIGRPHIARVLVNKGLADSVADAFERFLNRGKPGYAERYKLSIGETINIIKNCGGLSILAHPGLLRNLSVVNTCISLGIDGIECIHSKHTKNQIADFIRLAESQSLIITAGSDFHGDLNTATEQTLGRYYINIEDIPAFKERI